MRTGPFDLRVSENAERLDFEKLPDEQKKMLSSGIAFDSSKHDCYRLSVYPHEKSRRKTSALNYRQRKKLGYERVNIAVIDVEAGNEKIKFLGMLPVTRLVNGDWVANVGANGFIHAKTPHAGMRLEFDIKKMFQKKSCSIIARRNDKKMTWHYFEDWIQLGGDFTLQFICVIEKVLPEEYRKLICNVAFRRGGNKLADASNQKVSLPMT